MAATNGFVTIFCVLVIIHIALGKQPNVINWSNVQPGDLLHRLESLISGSKDVKLINSGKDALSNNSRQLNKSKPQNFQRRYDDTEDYQTSIESPYDYDSAYDAFVKKYFDDSIARDLSTNNSDENVRNYEDSYSGEEQATSQESQEPEDEETKMSGKTEKCINSIRNHRHCVICKNPRNGESSESCSYNKESTPTRYSFKKGNEYHKYRESPSQSSGSSSDEDPIKPSESTRVPLTCTQQKMPDKVCYYCTNHYGEQMEKCYTDTEVVPVEQSDQDRKAQKSHQRLFKRTVVFKYENIPSVSRMNQEIDSHVKDSKSSLKEYEIF